MARELTKLYEEVRRGRLGELAAGYRQSGPPKGEIVVVVGPPERAARAAADPDEQLKAALERPSLRDAAAAVAAATGLPKREVYARALTLVTARGGRKRKRG